jgi:hypothetical protein
LAKTARKGVVMSNWSAEKGSLDWSDQEREAFEERYPDDPWEDDSWDDDPWESEDEPLSLCEAFHFLLRQDDPDPECEEIAEKIGKSARLKGADDNFQEEGDLKTSLLQQS